MARRTTRQKRTLTTTSVSHVSRPAVRRRTGLNLAPAYQQALLGLTLLGSALLVLVSLTLLHKQEPLDRLGALALSLLGWSAYPWSLLLALLAGTQLAEAATVDPKRVELSRYHGLPHLLRPVVLDVEQVVSGLKDMLDEMERRYRLFGRLGVRNLDGYCKVRLQKRESGDPSLTDMAAIVIIIDELAELMREVPREGEELICRLAQLGRAAGMHLVLATQRPSVEVVTGRLKANIPTRIACMVSCAADSRSILERGGAERLLGGGDMLYLPADAEQPERIQGAFVAEEEVSQLVNYWREQAKGQILPYSPSLSKSSRS